MTWPDKRSATLKQSNGARCVAAQVGGDGRRSRGVQRHAHSWEKREIVRSCATNKQKKVAQKWSVARVGGSTLYTRLHAKKQKINQLTICKQMDWTQPLL